MESDPDVIERPTEITKQQYSRQQTEDLATSVSLAVVRFLKDLDIGGFGSTKKFAEVFEGWPSVEDGFIPTSASILPFELTYSEGYNTPELMEDTWEPKGRLGWGLWVVSAAEADVVIEFKAASSSERNAALSAIEGIFKVPHLSEGPNRYGVFVTMPEYFGIAVKLSLRESLKLDDADRAVQNVWEGQLTLHVHTKQVVIDRVVPFIPRTVEVIEGV